MIGKGVCQNIPFLWPHYAQPTGLFPPGQHNFSLQSGRISAEKLLVSRKNSSPLDIFPIFKPGLAYLPSRSTKLQYPLRDTLKNLHIVRNDIFFADPKNHSILNAVLTSFPRIANNSAAIFVYACTFSLIWLHPLK